MNKKKKFPSIDISDFQKGKRSDFFLPLYEDSLGQAVNVPFIVARGLKPGPCLGISAAVHGNELNGIKIIQKTLAELDLSNLKGSIICAPVVNIPGFNIGERFFSDGVDLNHVFPGSPNGVPAEQYTHAFVKTFLPACNYLVDIHTASEGRLNTMYVRVDLKDRNARSLAEAVSPEIILHGKGGDGTLRGAAGRKNIPAITLEAGNPSVFQGKMVFEGELGLKNILYLLKMLSGKINQSRKPVVCKSSDWLRTNSGGVLEINFNLADKVESKQVLAKTLDPFGNIHSQYSAPYSGIVIGKAANPVATPGTRFCHLGKIGEPK
ncbi:MAG: succinylglutamate desuccinylase/aspartoacylase family protein [Bdellovibrionales bacterium]|nr:succinylglutamate desuccinylase/aspartoacylase family protein [Bdellovibrionales bacterium]